MKKLTVLLPDEVHTQVVAVAKAQHRSVHSQILMWIDEALRAGGRTTPAAASTRATPHD